MGAFHRGAGDYYGLGGPGLTLCCPQHAEQGCFVGVQVIIMGWGVPG